ncbi:hypothetical protein M2109_003027 [Paenibacillus sp. PastH-3]|nr:hypothetical protein [Paenibacillus sp. PastH-4]MDH6444813.1 hypothetical protein [Paenibacillus sp. PastF-4]MDH6528709.1 hypothetical protein [Paenibacillus sp. PastH-3]
MYEKNFQKYLQFRLTSDLLNVNRLLNLFRTCWRFLCLSLPLSVVQSRFRNSFQSPYLLLYYFSPHEDDFYILIFEFNIYNYMLQIDIEHHK